MTRSGRLVGHRILRRALLPSHAIPYTDLGRLPTPLSCERPSQLIVGHLERRVDLVAPLLVKSGFCRIRFWYPVAPGSGISKENSRNYFWNLTGSARPLVVDPPLTDEQLENCAAPRRKESFGCKDLEVEG
jgi:hypothetical protein